MTLKSINAAKAAVKKINSIEMQDYQKKSVERKGRMVKATGVSVAAMGGSSYYLFKVGHKAVGYFVVALIAALLLGWFSYMLMDYQNDKKELANG